MDWSSVSNFWTVFGRSLKLTNSECFIPEIHSGFDFINMFHESHGNKYFLKRVVLFVDEFDSLYQAQAIVDSFLDTLQAIKQERHQFKLHSFVGVGPFSILELTSKSSSPFNVRDAIQTTFWNRDEICKLVTQYSTAIDPRIIDDIFERTSGHQWLVCFCCKYIVES
jgi:hypothetical protein